MDQHLDDLRTGMIGYFSRELPFRENSEPERGYISLLRDGDVRVDTLNEDVNDGLFMEDVSQADVLTGITEKGGMLLFYPWRGHTTNFGGMRASVFTYRANTMVTQIDPTRLKSGRIRMARLYFHGLGIWAGVSASKESYTEDSSGKLESWSITLSSAPEKSASVGSLTMTLGTSWHVDGPQDRRRLLAPISLSIESKRPREISSLLNPLMHAQDLINLAYGGYVAAASGAVEPHSTDSESAPLWNRRMMSVPRGVSEPKNMNEFPLFLTGTIGGMQGVARWVRLATAHRRAVGPAVDIYRVGAGAPESALLSVCAGIEYWVALHRRKTKWAHSGDTFAHALAQHVGEPFAEWVDGDPHTWSTRVWDTYRRLKHNPAAKLDSYETYYFAETARYLLGAALLDRCATSRAPSRHIFRSHRLANLGQNIRTVLERGKSLS